MMVDEMELVARLRDVEPLPPEVSEKAKEVLRSTMAAARIEEPAPPSLEPRPFRRRPRTKEPTSVRGSRSWRLVAGVVAAVAVVAGVGAYLASGTGSAGERQNPSEVSPPRVGHPAPAVLTASRVRLIASTSAAVMADSGTAVVTSTGSPGETDITFSGQNLNYVLPVEGAGRPINRVVNGQLYLYIATTSPQQHWVHDTSPNAAAGLSLFPDPRTLIQTISPAAELEDLGQQSVGGVELTHLRAADPAGVNISGLTSQVVSSGATVTAFDVWVDSDNVVRQLSVTSSSPSGPAYVCNVTPSPSDTPSGAVPPSTIAIPPTDHITTLPDGKPVPAGEVCGSLPARSTTSTVNVRFANLGAPESITVPSGAVDVNSVG